MSVVSILNVTPESKLCDPQGRPYFLWDMDLTLAAFRQQLPTGSRTVRTWLVGCGPSSRAISASHARSGPG
jgi:hypothetical protein